MKKSQVMVKERYTGFQLHWVNDSDGLNADDIDYAFAANGSIVKSIHDFKLVVQSHSIWSALVLCSKSRNFLRNYHFAQIFRLIEYYNICVLLLLLVLNIISISSNIL